MCSHASNPLAFDRGIIEHRLPSSGSRKKPSKASTGLSPYQQLFIVYTNANTLINTECQIGLVQWKLWNEQYYVFKGYWCDKRPLCAHVYHLVKKSKYVCMYVCMYACMYVQYVWMHVYRSIVYLIEYLKVCMYVSMQVYVYACMYVYMKVCMYVCTVYMKICIYIYIYIYIYIFLCMYLCIYI